VLVLWVFSADEAAQTLMSGFAPMWSFTGRVRLLRGGVLTVQPKDVLRWVTGRTRSAVAATPAEVDREMAASERAGPDKYGRYPPQQLLCGDASWEHALALWLARPGLVMMSLSGFCRENQGCATEIRRLVHELPLDRCVFLVDETTDRSLVAASMHQAWGTRPETSPNGSATTPLVHLLELTADGAGQHAEGEGDDDPEDLDDPKLVARDVDRMVDLLCLAAVRSGLAPQTGAERRRA
jgi:hypothetical protein